jgi:transcription termination/antitermination protein NusG
VDSTTYQASKKLSFMSDKNWYAVYTRPRWEKKVAQSLSKRRFENYCPINATVKQWSDRKKIVFEPMFTSYVFVRVTPREHASLLLTEGIVNFVYWLGQPAIIRNAEIDLIKNFLQNHQNITLEKIPVNVNDQVRVINGALVEHEGQVIAVKGKTVKVHLPSLGFMMSAETALGNVEVISSRSKYGSFSQKN